jgi:Cysteine-rich secretory protein family
VQQKNNENFILQTWNNQLASLADLNVKQCEMKHDDCFRTEKYPQAGQNLAIAMSTSDFLDISFFINNSISSWYEEKSFTSPKQISKCCGGKNFHKIGHFLQIVNEKAATIGCAIAKFSDHKWKNLILACNYSFGNMKNAPVYSTGKSASECEFEKNLQYPALCN